MKRPLPIIAAVVVVAALVIGILQSGGSDEPGSAGVAPTPSAAARALAGSPAPLAALHRKANALLPIGELPAQLKALRGHPVVLNVWGSWCNPCREEFPILQRVSAKEGRRVAFVGVATQDSKESAGAFLRTRPVSYPSFMDFDGKQANAFGVIGAPATIFYDRRGRRAFFHQGKYETDADLIADIRRYTGA